MSVSIQKAAPDDSCTQLLAPRRGVCAVASVSSTDADLSVPDSPTIRNIKLRMSRKMIYVSGLLACYRCHLDHTPEEWAAIVARPGSQERLIDYYSRVFQKTPLEIVSEILLRYPHLNEAANQILGSYNEFLGILSDQEKREALDDLDEAMSETDRLYQRARSLSHTFRDGLLKLVFDEQSGMDELTKNYGVF